MASNCENCRLRRKAEKKPASFIGWLWRWHTSWCPGWRAYQKELTAKPPDVRKESTEKGR